MADFAENPGAKFSAKESAERALRQVVEYRLYADLQRGWRITMPNLEQTGLLHVRYVDLPEIAADTDTWARQAGPPARSPADRSARSWPASCWTSYDGSWRSTWSP